MNNFPDQNQMADDIRQIIVDCEGWARSVAATARESFRQQSQITFKSDESPVTVTDEQIERDLKRAIMDKYPLDGFFGEEFSNAIFF